MKKSVTIKLIKKLNETLDDWGNPVRSIQEWEVFAERKSVTMSEFYKAASQDLKPTVIFEVYEEEYLDADSVVSEGVEYSIIRTYQPTMDKLELVCERKIADGH